MERIVIEHISNVDCRRYHATFLMSQCSVRTFDYPLDEAYQKDLAEVGDIGTKLVRELFDIHGVINVCICAHQIQVNKGEAFDWDDIEPGIIESLKKTFAQHGITPDQVQITKLQSVPKDEGKDLLAEWAEIIVRGTGGANAGHCLQPIDEPTVITQDDVDAIAKLIT